MRTVFLIGLVLAAGCKKEPARPVMDSPAQPASTAEQDALWKLAPPGAIAGFVASPRGVELIERGALAVRALLASAPELAPLSGQLENALRRATDAPNPTLADFGLTHDKGFAVFFGTRGPLVVILPVGDRDRFLAKVHGTKGADGDDLHRATCRTIDGRYACAEQRETLARLGGGNLDGARKIAGARGDLEFAGSNFTGPKDPTVAVVAQLAPGAVTLRGTVGGLPAQVTEMIGKPSRPRAESAAASGFGVLDLAPYLAKLPPLPITRGVTLDQLGKSIGGPLSFVVAAGTTDVGIRIPLNDPAPATTVLEHCTDLPPLAMAAATVKDRACHITVPRVGIEIVGWVEGKDLRIASPGSAKPTAIAPSPLATELAQNDWSAAFFGRGSYIDLKSMPGAADLLQTAPGPGKMILRALPLVNELGLGLRNDGDALHFVLGVRTAWANPDDVVGKLLAISSDQIASGAAAEIGKSIASASPGSPFAQDFKAGAGGAVGITAPVGMLAAIAIPAFMDYIKRSKKTEAALELDKLGKNAKRAYVEAGEFPKGEVALTPAAGCCGQPNNHCVSTPQDWQHPVWKALDFQIDAPSLFQYSYQSDGKTFTAKAVGDLDCDGTMITYELNGTSDNGNPAAALTEPPPNSD